MIYYCGHAVAAVLGLSYLSFVVEALISGRFSSWCLHIF
jgi:hypothetical protein